MLSSHSTAIPAHNVASSVAEHNVLSPNFLSFSSFRKEENDKKFGDSTLCSATELATLCAGMAVECEDSIAENVTIESIKERINLHKWKQKLL